MSSPAERPSSNGFSSPDRSLHGMLDGRQSQDLSIPLSPRSSVEFKSPDGSWDAMSGSFDSPRSSRSTSSIESPSSSNLTRSQSGKMKPRRNQSSYYDEETGTWKCRNCGGTYDVPNPGSRQRREHKKACEETQRLQAIKRAEEEQARRDEAARESVREAARLAALREQGLAQETRNHQEILRGSNTDHLLQNGDGSSNKVKDDPSIMGAFITTPDVPEREEVNFEAPKELIHNIERDSAGHLRETQAADAQSSKINGQERRHGQDRAELDRNERVTMEDFRERDLPSKHDLSAADQGQGGRAGSPLKVELSGELKPANGSSTPTSNRIHANGSLDHHWIDGASPFQVDQGSGGKAGSLLKIELSGELKHANGTSTPSPTSNEVHLNGSLDHQWIDKASSPSPKTRTSKELEQVKYCSPPASNGVYLGGTVYDRLVDLHDDPQLVVTRSASMGRHEGLTTRSASMGHGRIETGRIANLNHEMDTATGVHLSRALSMDRYGVGVTTRKDPNTRAAQLDRGTEAAMREEVPSRDSSPDDLIEVLIGRNHSGSSGLNHGVEMKQDHSKALVNGISDGRIGHLDSTAAPSVVSRRTQLDSARVAGSSREQSGSHQAAASSSKQSQSHSPRGSGNSSRNPSANPPEDDNLGAMIARNVGKFWMHAVSVGAVAVIAWVGKSLANRQQGPRGQAPRCRRGHYPVLRYYWED